MRYSNNLGQVCKLHGRDFVMRTVVLSGTQVREHIKITTIRKLFTEMQKPQLDNFVGK